MNKRLSIALELLFCVATVFLFFFLTKEIPIWSSDEGRFAEIAREMWQLRDYVVPQFNFIDYLEKPILAPALTALVFQIFGDNSLTARLVPISAALSGLVITYYFSQRLFSKRIAIFNTLVLLTTVGYVFVGRFAVIDMLMTFLISLSLFFLMTAYFEKKRQYYLFAYVCIGFAFLTKGLIGIVLPGLIFLCFLIGQKDLKEILKMKLVAGFLIVCAIILPWLICVSLREPEFLKVFIVEHHFNRFTSGSFGRARPFWFFVPIVFGTAFPWTLFLPASWMELKKERNAEYVDKLKFLFTWIIVIFVFFSLPKSKLPYYLLPACIPIAMLVGYVLSFWCMGKEERPRDISATSCALPIFVFVCFGGVVALMVYFNFFEVDPQVLLLKSVLTYGSLLLMLGAVSVYILMRMDKRLPALLVVSVMIYALFLLSFDGMRRISPFQSTFKQAELIKGEGLEPTDMVAIYASPDHYSDLPFHLKKRVAVIGSNRGTLSRESNEEENLADSARWFYDQSAFVDEFNKSSRSIFAIMEKDQLNELVGLGLKGFKTLNHEADKILIRN